MDGEPTPENSSAPQVDLKYALPESEFDMQAVVPHACMVDMVQLGNYVHCNIGQHGMRIPAGKMLTRLPNGKFDLVDQPMMDSTGQIVAPNFTSVVN